MRRGIVIEKMDNQQLSTLLYLQEERVRKTQEMAAIDRQIELLLSPDKCRGVKRTRRKSGKEWERRLLHGGENERLSA